MEFSVIGVAPRVGVFVQFDPPKLISALIQGKLSGQIPVSDLVAAFTTSGALPFTVVGPVPDAAVFAQAMADRVVAAYGSMVPAPDASSPAYVALQPPASNVGGLIQWDLSQPVAAPRFWAITLDPIGGARAKAGTAGPASLVKQIAIPPLELGFAGVDIAANLPAVRIGAPAMGATVKIAPNPPMRPAAESVTISFTPPDDRATANLRLGSAEPLNYIVSAFAVWSCGRSTRKFDAAARALAGNWVQLQPADFPVKFTHLKAEARLLALASVQGAVRYTWNGKAMQQPFTLTAAAPEVAIAMPAEVNDATIAATAAPLDGSAALALPQMTTDRAHLDFTSFPECGPHIVTIECVMSDTDAPLFIEVIAEASIADLSATPAKLAFTADRLTNRWGYVAQSPFRSGYRFRVAAANAQSPQPWSGIQSPFGTLTLDATGAIATAAGAVRAPMATAAH